MAFQSTTTGLTSLSDFPKLVLTLFKTSITKSQPEKLLVEIIKILILLDLIES